jgi:hypothetical protein
MIVVKGQDRWKLHSMDLPRLWYGAGIEAVQFPFSALILFLCSQVFFLLHTQKDHQMFALRYTAELDRPLST